MISKTFVGRDSSGDLPSLQTDKEVPREGLGGRSWGQGSSEASGQACCGGLAAIGNVRCLDGLWDAPAAALVRATARRQRGELRRRPCGGHGYGCLEHRAPDPLPRRPETTHGGGY